jgi:hypothetical protein
MPDTPRLTGPALLNKAAELDGKSKSEQARACGYLALTKEGKERVDVPAFLEAMLEANGHSFAPTRPRRVATGVLTVSKTNTISVGKAYLSKIGAVTGDTYKVEFDNDMICLVPQNKAAEQPPVLQQAPQPALV